MTLLAGKALSLSEKGRRQRQEDYVASAGNTVFVVCDGLGAHGHGDIASRTVAESICASLSGRDAAGADDVGRAVMASAEALGNVAAQNDIKEMGTTVACVSLSGSAYIAAHIGDSRIYHIRPSLPPDSRVIYKSWDHSLVNMLVRLGQISEDEASRRSDRNVLLKAMLCGRSEPVSRPEIYVCDDVQPGDYLFLCTDGVWNTIDDTALLSIISDSALTDDMKMERIKTICEARAGDNYSAWVLPL